MAFNTRQNSTTGKSSSLIEKWWNPLFPVYHLKKSLLNIHPTAKDFYYIWKKVCDTEARCIAKEKEYTKTHKEPELREDDQVLVSNLNFNNIKGPKKMRDLFLGPFTIIGLIGKNVVEVKLTEELSRKHPVFPVSLVKQYHQTGDDKLPCRNKGHTPHAIVKVEDSPGPVKKVIKARSIRLNGKDHKECFVRLKNQTADKYKCLAEDSIPYLDLETRRFRASSRS
ncbi:hypothetical protein O181_059156 [Austropuccinia psidii MF-1]|uniref:Tf2-1-like SH3-like domain-containing protein n=1 Tax=Austropuccinia psidii MF-1 TaxID=1389203 RepID=A0A9Q3EIF8_9BASI|nr:hypothetical protein [Austropuccinia psidii MF-1]